MTNLSHWLDSLGLGEYRQPFAANAVDASVLHELTERDLSDLGVRVGHRRKLLRAIAELRAAELRPPDATAMPIADDGERRHLTVLFCDLAGSAALSERLDVDDMGKVMTSYHECVAGIIARHGGFVDERQGDGVLALFGFPEAHEDDAERAVHAGLALADAVGNLRTELATPLQVRVGIATGTVVVRREVGQGADRKQRVVGEPANLAARLQTLANLGTVVTCANTRALAGGLFDCRALGASSFKGWSEPVATWQVLGPSGVESRFEAKHASRIPPPFGRDEELELLQRRWKDGAGGEGRVVILTGEAGIGKSHIVLAMQDRLAWEPHARLRFFCSPHHVNSVLFPFIGQLERAARFERRLSSEEKRARIAALFAESLPHVRDAVPLVSNLLSLTTMGRDELQELSPQKRKERTLAVLLAQLEATAARQPVFMIFEDAQWIDPTSLELLALVVERVPQLPMLLLITARTMNEQFRPPWASQPHVKTMVLSYLGRGESEALARRAAGGKALPDEVMEEILDRADGVPLYVEEYTKTVLNRPSPSLAIPNTLRASLMERLDRLGGEARHAAQTAAVVGREFSYELLSAVPGLHGHNLDAALGELVRAELLFQRDKPPHAVYRFKHALLRDEAYDGLVKIRRVALHAAIASALEDKFPEVVSAQPETLGHHLSRARLPRRALPYWLRAGRNAAKRFANVEAIAHLRKGMEEAGALAEDGERDRFELELTFELGQCLIATQGPASEESLAAFDRARRLCERLGEAPQYPQVMFWLATAGVVRGELQRALEATIAMQGAAEAQGDSAAVMNSVRGQGMIHLFMGRLVEAKEGFEHALALFNRADEPQRLAARAAGQDSGAAALAQLSWVLWLMGSSDAAVVSIEAALERAHAIGHPHTEAYTAYYASILYALREEHETARCHATRCLTLSEKHGFRQWLGLSRAIRATCMSMLAPSSGTLEEVQEDIEKYCGAGYQLGITVLHVLRCHALLLNRRPEAALEAAEHGLSAVLHNNERILEAELCRLKARALLDCGSADAGADARLWLDRALATARRQGARSLELRAAQDLAAL